MKTLLDQMERILRKTLVFTMLRCGPNSSWRCLGCGSWWLSISIALWFTQSSPGLNVDTKMSHLVSKMPNSYLLKYSSLPCTHTWTFSSLEIKPPMNGNFQLLEYSQQPSPFTSWSNSQTSENMHSSLSSLVSEPVLPSTTSKTAKIQTLSTDSFPNLIMISSSSCKESSIKFILKNSSSKEIIWPRRLWCHLSSSYSISAIQSVPLATTKIQEISSFIQFMRSFHWWPCTPPEPGCGFTSTSGSP